MASVLWQTPHAYVFLPVCSLCSCILACGLPDTPHKANKPQPPPPPPPLHAPQKTNKPQPPPPPPPLAGRHTTRPRPHETRQTERTKRADRQIRNQHISQRRSAQRGGGEQTNERTAKRPT